MQDFLRNLRIGTKIVILVVLMLLLMSAVIGFGLRQMKVIGNELKEVVEDIPLTEVLNKVAYYQLKQSNQLERSLRVGSLVAQDKAANEVFKAEREKFLELGRLFDQDIEESKKMVAYLYKHCETDKEKEKVLTLDYELRGLHKEHKDYQFLAERIFNLLSQGKLKQAESAIREIGKEEEDVYGVQNNLSLAMEDHIKDSTAHAIKSEQTAIISMLLFSILILMLCLSLGIFVSRSISKPIMKLMDATTEIGRGKIGTKTRISSKDEIGQLSRAFDKMTDDLEKTTTSIDELSKEIAERKRAEEMLRDAQEQLVRKEKLATMGQIAGGLGHELRNPLGAIKNAVYLLNMILEEPQAEVKETIEIIEKEVGISERVITSLLDFARPKPSARHVVDINDIVRTGLSRVPVPEDVEVMSQLNEALPTIWADSEQLTSVFTNLILNAIQAMPEGGGLVVKSDVTDSNQMALTFADTGVGIPQEKMEKIFEPLFTTKAKGIGLGLALTKLLVERNGGTIDVESEVGKGATFTVSLPISREEQE